MREKRRHNLCNKLHGKRMALKKIICDINVSDEEKAEAVYKLQEMPRDSSIIRQRKRCNFCGRSRSNTRLTGLCRIHMRNAVMNGLIPGMRKASW